MLKDDFARIDDIVDGRALIINDEIYANAYFDDQSYSAVQVVDAKSPIAVTNGFSKGHRMYARRCGWAVVPDEIVEPLTGDAAPHAALHRPGAAVRRHRGARRRGGVDSLVETCRKRRDYTVEQFEGVDDVYAVPSRGGFYFTLECSAAMRKRGLADSLTLARRIMGSSTWPPCRAVTSACPRRGACRSQSAAYEAGLGPQERVLPGRARSSQTISWIMSSKLVVKDQPRRSRALEASPIKLATSVGLK